MKKKNLLSYLRYYLSEDEIELMRHRVTGLMIEKKPFLQKGYHIKNMSDELQIPVHQLSGFINHIVGMHFSDHMNKYRIEYCLELINENLPARANLNEVSKKCGFNNRSSFSSAFKKFTGQKPFEYIQRKSFHQLMMAMS